MGWSGQANTYAVISKRAYFIPSRNKITDPETKIPSTTLIRIKTKKVKILVF